MIERTCLNCALLRQNNNICPILNRARNEKDYPCENFISRLQFCESCGRVVLPTGVVYDMTDGKPHLICEECQKQSSTCARCKSGQKCDFMTNPSTIPHTIQKEIHQGNMRMVVEVRNPERVAITCAKGCECFDAETETCNKDLGLCGRWSSTY